MKLMATLPDKSIDLAIVDPPYGLSESGSSMTGGTWSKKYGSKIKNWDKKPTAVFFTELFRVSNYQIIWGGNYFTLPPSRNFIIWRKKGRPENFTMAMCEYAWTNIKGNAKVFEFHPWNANRIHPTQKPIELYKWLLSRYAKQGMKILDTHFGSGSIAVACNMMGFSLIASEIDKEYFRLALNRIKQALSENSLWQI
jgi:site-specific DNA-methyltransferase (adenine-specific)